MACAKGQGENGGQTRRCYVLAHPSLTLEGVDTISVAALPCQGPKLVVAVVLRWTTADPDSGAQGGGEARGSRVANSEIASTAT